MHRASSNVRPRQTAAKAGDVPDGAVTADGAASRAVWAAAVLGIAAAWVAAGSTGLLAHGLRHAITWVLLLVCGALAWPVAARWRNKAMLLAAAAATVALTASTLAAVNVLAVSLFVAAFAAAHAGAARAMLLTAAGASGVLGLFQIGQSSVASFWQASNAVAGAVGAVGGTLAGQSLNVGSTFAGLDYLVAVFAVLCILGLDGRLRGGSLATYGILAVLGHLVYLAIVANSEQILTVARTARNERLLATYFSPASRAERESLVGPITFKAQGPGAGALEQGSDAALAMQAEEQRRFDRELEALGLTRDEIDEIVAHVVDNAGFPDSVAPATRTALLDRLKPNLDALEHRELDLPGRRAPYTWDGFVLAAVPWNLPAVAILFHLALIAVVLWWAFWPSPLVVEATIVEPGSPKSRGSVSVATPFYRHRAMPAAVFVLSLLAAGVMAYSPGPGWHQGKRIVAYEKGFLNWLKADYGNMRDNMNFGRLSVGMYGMFGPFVESLGMEFSRSKDLSAEDLAGAEALVMFYPNRRWKRSQVERIVEFVERGGTLLVAGEHTIHEAKKDGLPQYPDEEAEAKLEAGDEWVGEEAATSADEPPVNRVNDLLEHFGMRIAFDSAEFAVGGWLQSYGAIAHATTSGLRDERNVFGAVVGASVDAPPPAVPLIIGRYGIGDMGDQAKQEGGSYMGDSRYNSGERLGDIVLAAEKRVGDGRVIVFGDTSSFTNNLTVSSHPYTARLMAYLAAPAAAGPQTAWRQAISWVLLAAALGLMLVDRRPMTLVALSGGLACGIWLFSSMASADSEVLPTGQLRERNNVAYIDTSHHGAHSDESLRDDGLMGLTSMLVRHDYLALQMSEFSGERLMDHPEVRDGRYGPSSLKARLVVSIAPQREYSAAECDVMDEYIARGGRLILTVGADDAGPVRRLLERFQMRVGAHASPLAYGVAGESSVVASYPPLPGQEPREPTPLGHFKSGYTRVVDDLGEYEPFVRFHAGWPIVCGDPNALVITRYAREEVIDQQGRVRRAEFPLIVIKRHGLGLVAVIGDSGFAMNKNLERTDGLPIEGLRENAFFWRWFLDLLEYEVNRWMPPRQVPAGSEPDLQQTQPPASDELDLRKKIEDLLKITPSKSQGDSNGGAPRAPDETRGKAAEPPQAKDIKSDEKDADRKAEDRTKERAPRELKKAGERGDVKGPLLLPPPADEKEGEKKDGEQKEAGQDGKEAGK